ncbi:AraC family transcriptional regulator [Rhodoplanes sp. TEM]|uniref:AraC family transcriptional regulator n=1 Tax=Rhodoplanes tepidamans TaxID=200616 RepID=A0ABT5JAX1_RHOTP|nr:MULTISPECIES: AraC family transcriptional regulator [Rhodoplanes]MDC7786797.1 AraC family transcriptional regulator [Rhodoplanes tepidamans]MDC7987839.1 AraC family transcriptional regulator [Rhodoplanes sp. TEM]MDQ0355924.1 AraC-like DNA-binding protein [Rhodoplanes tepidamans]
MTGRPENPTDRPADTSAAERPAAGGDPLSDLLRSVRLVGGVFLDARFTAPWSISARMTAEDCLPFLKAPAQLVAYHVAVSGRFALIIDGEPPLEVRPGEIVLLPRNDVHVMASAPDVVPVSARALIRPAEDGGLAHIDHGGGGDETRMVCGFLATEDVHVALAAVLPRVLKVDIREAASRDLIEASVRFAANELASGRLGSSEVMSRLSELLLAEAMRHATAARAADAGLLRGLADPQIGRALALIHRDLAAPWSADRLARAAGLSRTAFVERFGRLVGMPPIRYLTAGRLETARLQLRETARSAAQIAHAVGYESEEAFSRAFKRAFGLSPAAWRRTRADADGGETSRAGYARESK